jgi:hypothetical protein
MKNARGDLMRYRLEPERACRKKSTRIAQRRYRHCTSHGATGRSTMKNMPLKLALLAGLGAAFAGATYAPPAAAQTYVTTRVVVAPPPPRFERMPPPRAGYVWAPGYWRWDGYRHRHVWVGGYWVHVRPGYAWHPGGWDQGPGGWRFHNGYWAR